MEDYLTKRALGHITPYHHFFGDTSASSSGLVGDSISNVSKFVFFYFCLNLNSEDMVSSLRIVFISAFCFSRKCKAVVEDHVFG